MHTKDILAQALREAGLPEMAGRAAIGHYHDYLSPLDQPTVDLVLELTQVGTPAALALRARVIDGEFDASQAEAEAWAVSDDGKLAFAILTGKEVSPTAQAITVPKADVEPDPALPPLTPEHFRNVCRPGQKAATCRYLTAHVEGTMCAKGTVVRRAIDERVGTMVSKGDNCEGRSGSIPVNTPYR